MVSQTSRSSSMRLAADEGEIGLVLERVVEEVFVELKHLKRMWLHGERWLFGRREDGDLCCLWIYIALQDRFAEKRFEGQVRGEMVHQSLSDDLLLLLTERFLKFFNRSTRGIFIG